MSDLGLEQQFPIGGPDSRSLGWWAMVMIVITEGALFGYILFSYFYLWIQPQPIGTFPEGGAPPFTYSVLETVALVLSSIAVIWAQTGLARYRLWRVAGGLGLAALLGMAYLALEFSEWAHETFTLAYLSGCLAEPLVLGPRRRFISEHRPCNGFYVALSGWLSEYRQLPSGRAAGPELPHGGRCDRHGMSSV